MQLYIDIFFQSSPETTARRKIEFANDAVVSRKVTLEACPDLLNTTKSAITCQNHHIQVIFGTKVPVVSAKSGEGLLSKQTMTIPTSRGTESKRVIDFTDNILVPYMEGGRLSDIFKNVPRYQSTMLRYPLYVTIATRLVEAVRFLHSHHVAHLAIEPSSVICSSFDCDEIMLTDFSRSSLGTVASPYANELMQDAVKFASYEDRSQEEEEDQTVHKVNDEIVKLFKEYAIHDMKTPSWSSAFMVDWYAVGGTFYSVLTKSRYAPDNLSQIRGPSVSKDLAEYIFKTFEDRKVLDRVQGDSDSATTLKRVRNSVTEGLMLIDGLLNPNRESRISLDPNEEGDHQAERSRSSLRKSHALMSALQVENGNQKHSKKSTTCVSFMEKSLKQSKVLHDIDVMNKASLPSFMRELC